MFQISRPDDRASATYLGSLAVGFVAVVLGIIVCLDVISLPRHLRQVHGITCGDDCKLRKKLRMPKKREVRSFSVSAMTDRTCNTTGFVACGWMILVKDFFCRVCRLERWVVVRTGS